MPCTAIDLGAIALGAVLLAPGLASAAADTAAGTEVRVLVPAAVMHAVEGITFGGDGLLYGASLHGQSIYRIDPHTGVVTIAVPAPYGEADDVAVGPAGTPVEGVLAWTALSSGEIRIRRPGREPEVVLRDVPRVNPIAFSADGRLFTAQVGAGDDALWELDLIGGKPPRLVAKGQGRLNGFGFGPDGRLYAPLFGTDRLVAIDVSSGTYTPIATAVGSPAAAKPDGRGNVLSVDYLTGDLWRTSLASGSSQIIASFREPLDNLAIDRDGTVYVSNVADSSITAFDPATGSRRDVVRGGFTVPFGMSLARFEGRPALLVADPFGYRWVDPESGAVTRPPWAANRGASTAVVASERFIALSNGPIGRIRKIDRASGQVVAETSAVKSPRGIALTSRDEVLVADAQGDRLVKLTADGIQTLASGLHHPTGLVLESDTVAWVTEFDAGSLRRIDLATGQQREIAAGLRHPTGIARMKDGHFAVVEPELGQVVAIDPATGARTALARGLALGLDGLDFTADTNAGIAVGEDGSVFVACPGDNSIVKISPKSPGRRSARRN